MAAILHLVRNLETETEVPRIPWISVRTYAGEEDVARWLEIRNLSFGPEIAGGRDWSSKDFHREFTSSPGWTPKRMWFADVLHEDSKTATATVGTVTLHTRRQRGEDCHVVNWLGVRPDFRRRGVARALLATLERHCFQAGLRRLRLETLSEWTAAVGLYLSLGYQIEHSWGGLSRLSSEATMDRARRRAPDDVAITQDTRLDAPLSDP